MVISKVAVHIFVADRNLMQDSRVISHVNPNALYMNYQTLSRIWLAVVKHR